MKRAIIILSAFILAFSFSITGFAKDNNTGGAIRFESNSNITRPVEMSELIPIKIHNNYHIQMAVFRRSDRWTQPLLFERERKGRYK